MNEQTHDDLRGGRPAGWPRDAQGAGAPSPGARGGEPQPSGQQWPGRRQPQHGASTAGPAPAYGGQAPGYGVAGGAATTGWGSSAQPANPYAAGGAHAGATQRTGGYGAAQPGTASAAEANRAQSSYGLPEGYGRPPATAPAADSGRERKRRSGRGAIAVLSVLLPLGILAGGIVGYVLAHEINSLDERRVEAEVADVLRNDFGMSDLAGVNCPSWIKVEQGAVFQCEFEYAGALQTVTVTQGSQSGQLIVGAPEQ